MRLFITANIVSSLSIREGNFQEIAVKTTQNIHFQVFKNLGLDNRFRSMLTSQLSILKGDQVLFSVELGQHLADVG
jgi:hypothetical protein